MAVAVTQGLAYGANLPTLGISSLAAMAWGALQEHEADQALVALDARMSEVYWGHYRLNGSRLTALHDHDLCAPEQLPSANYSACLAIGNGWTQYESALTVQREQCIAVIDDYPQQAVDVANYAAGLIATAPESLLTASELQALYLRNKVTG